MKPTPSSSATNARMYREIRDRQRLMLEDAIGIYDLFNEREGAGLELIAADRKAASLPTLLGYAAVLRALPEPQKGFDPEAALIAAYGSDWQGSLKGWRHHRPEDRARLAFALVQKKAFVARTAAQVTSAAPLNRTPAAAAPAADDAAARVRAQCAAQLEHKAASAKAAAASGLTGRDRLRALFAAELANPAAATTATAAELARVNESFDASRRARRAATAGK